MRAVVLLLCALLVAACGSEPVSAPADPGPTEPPRTTPTPPPDFKALDDLVDAADSTCTVVMRGDDVLHEYPAGSRHRTRRVYSITKSIVGALVAIAVEQGRLDLDDPVRHHVGRWPDESRDVTVRDLMSMTSGRTWTPGLDAAMIASDDRSAAALAAGQQDAPGSVWRYDNLASQVLSSVLTSSVGDIEAFARERLFEPVGMTDTSWERDPSGTITTYAGIVSSCADLARFAVMMRDGGRFDGHRILPEHGVRALTRPSSEHNAAYGLLWWTNATGHIVEVRRAAGFDQDRAPFEGRLAPNAPADTFWAFGWGNQFVAVVPSRDLVAVRLGPKPAGADELTFDAFTAAAVTAVSPAATR